MYPVLIKEKHISSPAPCMRLIIFGSQENDSSTLKKKKKKTYV